MWIPDHVLTLNKVGLNCEGQLKTSVYKWTQAVQTRVVQGSTESEQCFSALAAQQKGLRDFKILTPNPLADQ